MDLKPYQMPTNNKIDKNETIEIKEQTPVFWFFVYCIFLAIPLPVY